MVQEAQYFFTSLDKKTYWERVRTFVITPDETTTEVPLSYSENPSSPYYQEMLEVYEDNNAAADKDEEQLWIAEFWSDDVENLTFSPPARQIFGLLRF